MNRTQLEMLRSIIQSEVKWYVESERGDASALMAENNQKWEEFIIQNESN